MDANFIRGLDPKVSLGIGPVQLIKSWLESMDIENYFITRKFLIDVYDDVDLGYRQLVEFPEYINFRKITGSFICSHNDLRSLRGSPHIVRGSFHCCNNQLSSLEFGPYKVEGSYLAHSNNLTSLKHMPKNLNTFSCNNNLLKSLEYLPEEIHGDLYCKNNYLSSLKHLPKRINGNLVISFNKYSKFSVEEIRDVCWVEGNIHIL
jgi:hypothetical protein